MKRQLRPGGSNLSRRPTAEPVAGDPLVVRSSPPPASAPVGGSGEIRWPRVGRTDGHRCVLAACPRAWDCAGFAGGAFLAPNDRRRGEAVGSPVCPARKPAFPGCETAPPWRTQARRACYRWSSTRPWCFTPSLRRLRLSLWTSGAGWPHDGVLKRALGRCCGLPSFYLIGAGFVKQTFVCIAGAGRRPSVGLRGNDLNAVRVRRAPARVVGKAEEGGGGGGGRSCEKPGIDGFGRFG